MEETPAAIEQRAGVLALAIRRVEVGHCGWRVAAPGALVTDSTHNRPVL
jgi:hypothetical protein